LAALIPSKLKLEFAFEVVVTSDIETTMLCGCEMSSVGKLSLGSVEVLPENIALIWFGCNSSLIEAVQQEPFAMYCSELQNSSLSE
jgi:hypothetical protein